MKKRVLPLLLCMAMLLSMVPSVLAAEKPEVTAGNQTAESPAADSANLATEHTPKESLIEQVQETVGMVATPSSYQSEPQSEPEIRLMLNGELVTWKVETDEVPGNLPAGVSYARENHTLTLQNADLSGLELYGFGDLPLTVRVSGENTIAVASDRNSEEEYRAPLSISLCNNVTFTGGGTLNVTTLYHGEPSVTRVYISQTIPAHETFVAEDTYSYDHDASFVVMDRESTLSFDNVSININNMIQESTIRFEDNYGFISFDIYNTPADIRFGQIEIENNSSISISGLSQSAFLGNVVIDETSSLTANSIAFGLHDRTYETAKYLAAMWAAQGYTDKYSVIVKGELTTRAVPDEIIQAHLEAAKNAYPSPSVKLSVYAPSSLIDIQPLTWLKLDGGTITTEAVLVTGLAEICSGTLSVSSNSNRENGAYEAGLNLAVGKFIQTGGKVLISGANYGIYADRAALELNGGTMDIILPESSTQAVCINANSSIVNCGGTDITAYCDGDADVDTLTGIAMRGQMNLTYSGGFFTLRPAGTIGEITLFSVDDAYNYKTPTVQINGGNVLADLTNCTYNSFTGVAASGGSSFSITDGNMSMKLNSASDNIGFSFAGEGVGLFSGGTVDISVTEDAPDTTAIRENGGSRVLISGTATLKLGTDSTIGYGIVCSRVSDYLPNTPSELTIEGTPTIEIESSQTGISIIDSSEGEISGGTIHINQKCQGGRTGIFVDDGTLSITGGKTYVRGIYPLEYRHAKSQIPVVFGTGINAMVLDSDGNPSNAASLVEETYQNGVQGYFEDPEAEDQSAEFNMLISQDSSVSPKYNGSLKLVNTGAITAGLSYHARFKATLTTVMGDVTFTLSDGMQVVADSVTVNDKPVSYSLKGNVLTVHINSGNVVRFDVIPAPGDNRITSSTGNEGESETVEFKAAAYTFSAPTDTNTPIVHLGGTALAEANVDIYVNGKLAGTTTASKAGNWSASVTVLEGENEIYISVTAGSNQPIQSESVKVRFAPTATAVETLTISNWIYGRTRIDPLKKVESTVDYRTGTFNRRYYIYWPDLPEFEFAVAFAEGTGTPETIKDVAVVATDWKNKEQRIPLSYDSASGKWTGKDKFCTDGYIYPEMFRVEWHSVHESNADPVHKTENSSILGSGDPSGYVFEGIPSNRLEGVTVELYNSRDQLWPEAADFDQEATQETDEMGQYLWMVPKGNWKVKYHKEGYEDAETDYMEVPPIRTEVNQSLVSFDPGTVTADYDTKLEAIVLRFSKPVQVTDVLNRYISLSVEDNKSILVQAGSITPVDAADSVLPADSRIGSTNCATTFLVTLKGVDRNTGEEISLNHRAINMEINGIRTYAWTGVYVYDGLQVVYGADKQYAVTVVNGTPSLKEATPGTEITVTAQAAADGYVFSGWTVECAVDVYVPNTATASFVMPAADITLTAHYKKKSGPENPPESSTKPKPSTTPGTTPSNPTPSASPAPNAYPVSADQELKNGSIKVTSGDTSAAGKEVTFTVTPDEGYKIATVTVTDKSGKQITVKDLGDGKYQFVMPAGTVKIDATFEHVCLAELYTDLDPTLWYHDAVDYVLRNGLMKGVGDGTFAPLQTTDRAMLTTILYNVEKRPEVTSASTFEDVAADKYYADPIAWAEANKVVAGTSETTFEPEKHITREQMAVMLYNYAVLKGYDVTKTGTLEAYTDADEVSSWAEAAMGWATANGIMSGVSSDPTVQVLNPQGNSSRVEMAALIMNFLQTFAAEKTAE